MKRLQDIDLTLLRVFCTIVDAGGGRYAQVLLNSSQPALSPQPAEMDARLDFGACEPG